MKRNYICPVCGTSFWKEESINIFCPDCGCEMITFSELMDCENDECVKSNKEA